MSGRYIALTVLLERPIKDEDARAIIDAIRMLEGVLDVTPVVADPIKQLIKILDIIAELTKTLSTFAHIDFTPSQASIDAFAAALNHCLSDSDIMERATP